MFKELTCQSLGPSVIRVTNLFVFICYLFPKAEVSNKPESFQLTHIDSLKYSQKKKHDFGTYKLLHVVETEICL